MPRVAIPVTDVPLEGVAPPAQTAGSPTDDHVLTPGTDAVLLEVENVSTEDPHSVTIVTPAKVDGLDVEDLEIAVPKEATRLVKVQASEAFRLKGGKVNIDVASANLKFRCYRV